MERTCNYNLEGFTSGRINCKVNGNVITIKSGFAYAVSTTMTDNDSMIPPTMKFRLPQFWNPRTMDYTDPFKLAIFSYANREIYSWDGTSAPSVNGVSSTAITPGPVIKMSTAATP